MSKVVTFEHDNLICKCEVETGDWEGDPSVPNGVNYLGDYAEVISVKCWYHGMHASYQVDITHLLSEEALDAIAESALDE